MSTKTIIPCLLVLLFLLTLVHSEDNDIVELIQRFVHPNITSDSPIDPTPFVPAQDRDRGFLGIRVLCKCGIQNNRTKNNRASREVEDALPVPNETTFKTTSEDSTPDLSIDHYVSNGTEAEINEYPWVVALVYNLGNGTKVHFCGGTLFSSRYILTAAHCLEGKTPETTEVWLNQHDILLQHGDTLQIKAERFIVHPKYHPYMLYNDISIIQLAEEVDIIRENYRPVCLPSLDFEPLDTTDTSKGVAAGWGQIYYSGPKSDKLLKVSVPILNNLECKEKSEPYYKRRITDHMLCAGNIIMGGPDTCPGDSGGPLFVNQDGKHVLTGIVSWGYRCGEPKRPGVYTRVSMYLGWINMEASRGGQRCAG